VLRIFSPLKIGWLRPGLTKFHTHFSVLPCALHIKHILFFTTELQIKYRDIDINVLLLIIAEDRGLFIIYSERNIKRKTVANFMLDVIKTQK
jgi:hypothetical protein